MEPVVSVNGLSVTYRHRFKSPEVDAVRELDLVARAGEIVGILGPNGSGKTTLLEVLCGSLAPSSGSVRILDCAPGDRSLVGVVGYQPEGPLPFPTLHGREFLLYLGDLMGLPRSTAVASADELLRRLELTAFAHRPVGTFSTGTSRRLAIASALIGDPKVLLLDEPTSGLDPNAVEIVLEVFRETAARGACVLMASHHLDEIEQTCDRVYLFESGRCRASGTLDELLGTDDLEMVIRGLQPDAVAAVEKAIEGAGGQVLRAGRERRRLSSLFRRPRRKSSGEP